MGEGRLSESQFVGSSQRHSWSRPTALVYSSPPRPSSFVASLTLDDVAGGALERLPSGGQTFWFAIEVRGWEAKFEVVVL